MRDGQVTGNSAVKDITRDRIIELMVGRSLDMEYPPRTAKPGEPILEVKNLCRRQQLKDISFTLHRGEILGFAGLVGAGRTELAEAIFGADPADSGEIILNGQSVKIRSTLQAKNLSIGLVTEDRKETGLVLPMDVTENTTITDLKTVSKGIILDRKAEEKIAQKYVDSLKTKTPSLHQKINNLSGGNQQKVAVAKWLYSNSDVLILDEPTRGIDVGAKFDMYCLMNELTEQGKAIIMISSELPEVLGMSDRVLVMHGGQIKGELTGEDMTAEKVMKLAID
jgi:ABC-type sugar transport system ATPase subunit